MRLSSSFAILALVAVATVSSQADTIYSTFGPGQTFGSTAYVVGATPGGTHQVVAAPFVPTETVTLSDAVLAMARFSGTDPVNVYIESSAGGAPGSILDTLAQEGSLVVPSGLVDFTCSSCSILNAGTMYFIVAQVSNLSDRTGWQFSLGPKTTIFINQIGSVVGPWGAEPNLSTTAFEVNGTTSTAATSEPSTLVFFTTGIIGMAGAVRRRFHSHR